MGADHRDASTAVISRFIVLQLSNSFYGKEDTFLTEKLLTELPGILNWAIEGYQRLSARGYFVQPKASNDILREMAWLASPVYAFVEECCEVEPALSVECSLVYEDWRGWCVAQGIEHPGTIQNFSRKLRAATTGLSVIQARAGGDSRVRKFVGIGLKAPPARGGTRSNVLYVKPKG